MDMQTLQTTQVDSKDLLILIAMPCYGGMMTVKSVESLLNFSYALNSLGIKHETRWVDDSLITRARNRLANICLGGNPNFGPYSHMLFLDVDISFNPDDMIALIYANKDVAALPYTRKSIDWKNVESAVKAGIPAEQLPEYIGSPVFDLTRSQKLSDLTPMTYMGTGTMLIKREVFEGLRDKHPEWQFNLTRDQQGDGNGRKTAYDFFQTGRSPEGFYLSEDYFFCQAAAAAGFEVVALLNARTTHTGTFEYVMNLPAILGVLGD
jgi:hypothetical protein